MDKNELRHVGILGMKWGKRKTRNLTPSSQHLSKRGGKTSIITRRWGDKKIIRRKEVSQKEAQAFVDKQRAQKTAEMFKNNQKRARVIKAARTVIAAYSVISIVNMMNPNFIRNVAWTTGRIVSNSPLR
jgi:hypothetical protein